MSHRADLLRSLATLAERPDPGHRAIAAALGIEGRPEPGDHAAVFLFGAYPYASVYLGAEGMLGGEARDRAAGFWRAIGLVPPAEPDHLAALLGLYAALVDDLDGPPARDDRAAEARSRAAIVLLWEHLLSWSTPFLDKVEELDRPFYADWARLLAAALAAEAEVAGPPMVLPAHLRSAPGLPDPDAAGDAWLAAILAPVRSGVVITRWDLRRGASEMGIASRVGERAFMLRSLMEQDPGAATGWLAAEAGRAAERHRAAEATLGAVARFWRQRAEASETALRSAA